jgi:hypothetical protein
VCDLLANDIMYVLKDSCTSTPCVLIAWFLIKNGDNFTWLCISEVALLLYAVRNAQILYFSLQWHLHNRSLVRLRRIVTALEFLLKLTFLRGMVPN